MTITRPQRKNISQQKNKLAPSAEEFIASAQAVTSQPEIDAEVSLTEYSPYKTPRQRALIILESYLPWAAASGITPIPVLDLAATLAVQLRMLSKISDIYGVPFRKQAARSAIMTLMAGCLQQTVAASLITSARFIPIIGALASITVLPALSLASTYAIGQVFINHFEAGGTYIDFDASQARAQFYKELKEVKEFRWPHTHN